MNLNLFYRPKESQIEAESTKNILHLEKYVYISHFPDLCNVKAEYLSQEIACEWKGQTIKGRIVSRSQHGLKVEITFPYSDWYETISINGHHKASPYHFMTTYGDVRAEEMLVQCFQKMKLLEEKWLTLQSLYKSLMGLIGKLGVTSKDEQSRIIRSVIESEWAEWIFNEPETGLILSVGQEEQLLAIIHTRLSIPGYDHLHIDQSENSNFTPE